MNANQKSPARRMPGKYVVLIMAGVIVAMLGLAVLLASQVTPQAREFHETHSPHP